MVYTLDYNIVIMITLQVDKLEAIGSRSGCVCLRPGGRESCQLML